MSSRVGSSTQRFACHHSRATALGVITELGWKRTNASHLRQGSGAHLRCGALIATTRSGRRAARRGAGAACVSPEVWSVEGKRVGWVTIIISALVPYSGAAQGYGIDGNGEPGAEGRCRTVTDGRGRHATKPRVAGDERGQRLEPASARSPAGRGMPEARARHARGCSARVGPGSLTLAVCHLDHAKFFVCPNLARCISPDVGDSPCPHEIAPYREQLQLSPPPSVEGCPCPCWPLCTHAGARPPLCLQGSAPDIAAALPVFV
ncbi:uncharacterized protein FIBRA_09609 [Fibroporia radiculosa]|uniref:Uncharacterized protein n=1 Tax=Fibroporia radiculosa TaxID=599839 RepID=J7RI59_9APHY|nr:uncharacterized protein FIBRA_09609 [Fibroporia radiculosa]CCM07262.1 predicted protein [Fibroporia radiculosa]